MILALNLALGFAVLLTVVNLIVGTLTEQLIRKEGQGGGHRRNMSVTPRLRLNLRSHA